MPHKISTYILKMKHRLLSISFIILFLPLHAQTEKEINEQVQFWTSINSTMRFSDHWGAMGDFHIRRNNFMKDPSFYFLRVGGVYWINDKISFAGGGAALWLATTTSETSNFALEKKYVCCLWSTSGHRFRLCNSSGSSDDPGRLFDSKTSEKSPRSVRKSIITPFCNLSYYTFI